MKCFISLLCLLVRCSLCFSQSGDERLKEFEIESYSSALPCRFNFEIISLSGNPDSAPVGERTLGTVTKNGKGATRTDYCTQSILSSDSPILVWHSLYVSPKERFAALRSGQTVKLLTFEEDGPSPVKLSDVNPFRLVFFPLEAIVLRSKIRDLSSYLKNFSEIRNAKSDQDHYYVSSNGNTAMRMSFEGDSAILREVATFVEPGTLDPSKLPGKVSGIVDSSQIANYKRLHSARVTWKEIDSVGYLPESISALMSSYVANESERETEIQIRFFGYNFDTKKIDMSVCIPDSFSEDKLKNAFDYKNVQRELENTRFSSSKSASPR